jgi:hypothetical protein
MEIGAIFILVIFAVIVAVGAALALGVGGALRREKMHPEEDKIEAGTTEPASAADEPRRRPEHVRVSSGQRARFIPER